jgi:hypothetical protein
MTFCGEARRFCVVNFFQLKVTVVVRVSQMRWGACRFATAGRPSPMTITALPSLARLYAVLNPAIPAPMTQTAARSSLANRGKSVPPPSIIQTEVVEPESFRISSFTLSWSSLIKHPNGVRRSFFVGIVLPPDGYQLPRFKSHFEIACLQKARRDLA